MKEKKSFLIITLTQLIFFSLTVTYFIGSDYLLPFILQYFILLIAFIFLPKSKGFILLIGYITLPLLGLLFFAFSREWNLLFQFKIIYYHIISIINASLIYMSAYKIRTLQNENMTLNLELEELRRYVKDSKLLTKSEFEQRSELIITAMKRRKEEGYKVYFSLEKANPHIQKALFDSLTSIAVETFRKEYDLIGQISDYSFVVLLQNTNQKGMELALNRYFTAVERNIDLNENKMIIDITRVGSNIEGEDKLENPVFD
ncbi:MAG: hypothetical protein GX198_00175 [Epulopiscium sp.]|nr:hypothetical protein [Candidatus Epulonipiscium sp.]